MALFNTELARSAAEKSTEARRLYSAQRKEWSKLQSTIPPLTASQSQAEPIVEPLNAYAERLVHAQNELLEELLTADNAKDKAALSQALKNLRETYHMATGAPKPGTIKPESRRTRQSPVRPPEPEPIDPGSNQ